MFFRIVEVKKYKHLIIKTDTCIYKLLIVVPDYYGERDYGRIAVRNSRNTS